jgi:hypothetical protein
MLHVMKKDAISQEVDKIAIETEIVIGTKVLVRKAERNRHKTIHRHDL